jgi:monoamine oxidase
MARSPLFSSLRNALAKGWWAHTQGLAHAPDLDARWRAVRLSRRTVLAGGGLAALTACSGGADDSAADDTADTGSVPSPARVVVIGAGIAGLHCAYRLQQAGVSVTLYEASDRVGGRMYSGRDLFRDGQICELGGELIDTNFATLWALSEEFGIQIDDRAAFAAPDSVTDTWFVDGVTVSEDEVARQFAEVAPTFAEQALRAETDDAFFESIDAMGLDEWLATYVPPDRYPALHTVLSVAYRGQFGLELDAQSPWNLLYLIDYESSDPFRIFGDSDERFHTHLGNDTFATALEGALAEGVLRKGHALTSLAEADGGYALGFRLSDGGTATATAEHVVLALPFSLLREVDLSAVTLSEEKRQIIAELGYGTNAKVMVGFATRPWNLLHNASGSMTTDLRLQQTWDTSVGQSGDSGILTNFLGGDQGLASGNGTAQEWAEAVTVPGVEAAWPGSGAAYSGAAVRMHWPTAPWAKGSYTCYKPGQWAFWSREGVREGNVHFCGEHASLDFQGWMEGGAETGALVAAEVLDDLGGTLSRTHRRALAGKLDLPQACYHGDLLPRMRWMERRRLVRARLGVRRG